MNTLGHEFMLMLQSHVLQEAEGKYFDLNTGHTSGRYTALSEGHYIEYSNLLVFLHLWKSCSIHSLITEMLETRCKSAWNNGAKEQNLHDIRDYNGKISLYCIQEPGTGLCMLACGYVKLSGKL